RRQHAVRRTLAQRANRKVQAVDGRRHGAVDSLPNRITLSNLPAGSLALRDLANALQPGPGPLPSQAGGREMQRRAIFAPNTSAIPELIEATMSKLQSQRS